MKNGKCESCDCGPNGKCSFDEDELVCTCETGYDVKNGKCEKKCSSDDFCKNGGICKNEMCICLEGTEGDDCGIVPECEILKCEEKKATCSYDFTSTPNAYCICNHPEYKFVNDKCVEKCSSDNFCKNGGVCENQLCKCLPGTEGDHCGKVSNCETLKCEEKKATCTYDFRKTPNTFCLCKDKKHSFVGDKCIECTCGPKGTCIIKNNRKECVCDEGFEDHEGYCKAECTCGPKGTCSFGNNKKICKCDDDFADNGGYCEECICGPKATCSFENNKKKCKCDDGYSDNGGICEECDCGPEGTCRFENGKKTCVCDPGFELRNGTCAACDCGIGGSCYFDSSNAKTCNCFSGYAQYYDQCYECDCGHFGVCSMRTGHKSCVCEANYAEKNGNCEYCFCGKNSNSCRYNAEGEKECNCSIAHAPNHGFCGECNCGPYGTCFFEYDVKKCNCKSFAVERNGLCIVRESTTQEDSTVTTTTVLPSTTQYCNCGNYSRSCRYSWNGDKICDCFPGYVENNEICEECNCGPYGSCSFKYGRKICRCRPFAVEMNGICIVIGTSSEGTTDSTTPNKFGSTTAQECDCGQHGRCTWEYGRKKCICDSLTWEKNGTCVECDCGQNTKSCRFDMKGDKVCSCISGYLEVSGICKECNCGVNAQLCYFNRHGVKVCNCDYGYIQDDGYCSAICNEDKCIHGRCEIVGNGFRCRCNESFTGERCEEKIQTKSNKLDLWSVLQLAVMFAIFILLSGMFCFWTGILNKMSKK